MPQNAHTVWGPRSAIYWVLTFSFLLVNLWLYSHRRMHTKCVCLFSLALICLPFVCRLERVDCAEAGRQPFNRATERTGGRADGRTCWRVAGPAGKQAIYLLSGIHKYRSYRPTASDFDLHPFQLTTLSAPIAIVIAIAFSRTLFIHKILACDLFSYYVTFITLQLANGT